MKVDTGYREVAHDSQALVQTVVWLMMMFSSLLKPPNPAGSVELAVKDVVHHAARVPDLEAARLDPAPHNGRADDGHLLAVGHLDQLPGVVLRNNLGDDGDDSDPGCGHSWSCISPPLSSGSS